MASSTSRRTGVVAAASRKIMVRLSRPPDRRRGRRPGSTSSSISRPRSRAVTLCVRPPIEMTSTPVAAMSATVARLTLPLASTRARPPTSRRRRARSAREKLSSMMVSTPAASTGFDLLHGVHLHLEVRRVAELRLGAGAALRSASPGRRR